MFSFEAATAMVIREGDLILLSVEKGIREVTLKGAALIRDFRQLPPAQLIDQLKEEIRSKGMNTENIVLGLERDHVIVRTVELPIDVEENLQQVVDFQMEKFEPLEDELSVSDFVVVARDQEQQTIQLEIFMAPASALDEPMALLDELGLYPASVRIMSHSLSRLLEIHPDGYPKSEPALIIEAAGRWVAFNLALGPGRAISAKASVQEGYGLKQVLSEFEAFVAQAEVSTEKICKIYLTGEEAPRLLPEFKERFEDCDRLFEKARLKGPVMTASQLEPLADALGLAISGWSRKGAYNLLPPEKRVVRQRPSLVPTLVLSLLLVLMGGAVVARGLIQTNRVLEQVDHRVNTYRSGVEATRSMEEQIKQRRARLDELQAMLAGGDTVLNVLRELTDKIPDDSYLESIGIQGDQLNLTGYSDKASVLLTILLQSECLQDVNQRFIIPGRDNKEKFRFEATIVECSGQ